MFKLLNIKIILLSLIFIGLCYASFSQSYTPIEFGNTRWMYTEMNFTYTRNYCYFSKDTTGYYFNGNKYWLIETLNSPTYTNTGSGIYITDDTIQHKVFVLDTITNQKSLLYDFSVSSGDTVVLNNFNQYIGTGMTTNIVDTTYYAMVNGVHRKHVILKGYPYTYIEGIGSTNDFLSPTKQLIDPSFSLACKEYNTNIEYGTTIVCSNFLTSIIDFPENPFKISYEPQINSIVILNPSNVKGKFLLYDITGKCILSKNISSIKTIIELRKTNEILIYNMDYKNSSLIRGKISTM